MRCRPDSRGGRAAPPPDADTPCRAGSPSCARDAVSPGSTRVALTLSASTPAMPPDPGHDHRSPMQRSRGTALPHERAAVPSTRRAARVSARRRRSGRAARPASRDSQIHPASRRSAARCPPRASPARGCAPGRARTATFEDHAVIAAQAAVGGRLVPAQQGSFCPRPLRPESLAPSDPHRGGASGARSSPGASSRHRHATTAAARPLPLGETSGPAPRSPHPGAPCSCAAEHPSHRAFVHVMFQSRSTGTWTS